MARGPKPLAEAAGPQTFPATLKGALQRVQPPFAIPIAPIGPTVEAGRARCLRPRMQRAPAHPLVALLHFSTALEHHFRHGRAIAGSHPSPLHSSLMLLQRVSNRLSPSSVHPERSAHRKLVEAELHHLQAGRTKLWKAMHNERNPPSIDVGKAILEAIEELNDHIEIALEFLSKENARNG